MSEQKPPELLTPLSITEKQRDFIAAQFHNLERDKAMLLQAIALKDAAIADLSRQLTEAQARISELEAAQNNVARWRIVGEAGPEIADAAAG